MNLEESQEIRRAWDKIAPGYDRNVTGTHHELGAEGLSRAGLKPGMSFLDVAAGTGALSIPAARAGAHVLATDHSETMLRLLSERARRDGLDIETRAMDGHALQLDDDSFDVVGSQFGVMLFPDMPKGISEMVRVVKPGGRVLVTALGDPARVGFFQFFLAAIRSVRPEFTGPPMDPPPLPFQLQDPERLRAVLASAGLTSVEVHTTIEPLEFRNGRQLWEWLISSNPIVEAVLGSLSVSDAERDKIKNALDAPVSERAGGGPVARLTVPINIGVGTK